MAATHASRSAEATDRLRFGDLDGREADIDEQESHRRFLERLSDWTEHGEIKINRNGKLLDPSVVPRQIEVRMGTPSQVGRGPSQIDGQI